MEESSLTPKGCFMQRKKPDIFVSTDVLEDVKLQARVAPLFELNVKNYTLRKHYSLETNEYLKCHWLQFKEKFIDRHMRPFEFINPRHFHFHKGQVEYRPDETVQLAKPSHPRQMKAGPCVDNVGQTPIPIESFARKSSDIKPTVKGQNSRPVKKVVPKKVEEPKVKINVDGKFRYPKLCVQLKAENTEAPSKGIFNAAPSHVK